MTSGGDRFYHLCTVYRENNVRTSAGILRTVDACAYNVYILYVTMLQTIYGVFLTTSVHVRRTNRRINLREEKREGVRERDDKVSVQSDYIRFVL